MSFKDVVITLTAKAITLTLGIVLAIVLMVQRMRKGSEHFKIKPRPQPPALLNDPRFGTHHFVNLPKQGIKLHYVEKGSKDNPLMVCLHGFPECWFSWKSVLEKFSDKHWVVAVDMRGYGASDKPKGIASYKTDLLVEDIREFVQILGQEKKCILMAHDWGGALGWLVTSKYPDLFEKHISLNGPHPTALREHRASSWSQMKKSWYIFFFQCWYIPELMMRANDLEFFNRAFQKEMRHQNALTDDEVEVYKYYYSQEYGLTAPINYYRNLSFTSEKSEICKVDSLIVWGVDDTALDREIADMTHRYCDKLQVDYITDCGHFVLHEKPDMVHQAVRNFLAT